VTAETDPPLQLEPVRAALGELAELDAVSRLHRRDPTLWSADPDDQAVVADRLGWLEAVGTADEWGGRLRALNEVVHRAGATRLVVLGMGGSSLAARVFAEVVAPASQGAERGLEVDVLDSTHPDAVAALLDEPDLSETVIMVSSKSGTTEETRALGDHAASLVDPATHFVAVSDPGSELAEQARELGWLDSLENPPDIGGRYSGLSLFGMAPAALAGVDVDAVWARAAEMLERLQEPAAEDNPATMLAAFMGGLARNGRDKLTLIADAGLAPFGDWVEQLVAESTGKDGQGVIPVVGEPLGEVDAYGDDRAFVELRLAGQPHPGVEALAEAGHPVLAIDIEDVRDLGSEMLRWEAATALAGVVLGVNPFDEPDVADSKINTRALLDVIADGAEPPEPENDDPAALVGELADGDYLAVQAFLDPGPELAERLAPARVALRDAVGVPVTFGWGPRYLHSTGQLHKGGPDSCVALQLVDEALPPEDPIPGRVYTFGTFLQAQAAGDLETLRARGRRVAQVAISDASDLDRVVAALQAATG
jgi:glucose-6-phosphate isomerase